MSLPKESAKEYLQKKYLDDCVKYFGIFCEDASRNTVSDEVPVVHQRDQDDKARKSQIKREYEKSSLSAENTEASGKTTTQNLLKRWEQGERVKLLTLQGDKSAGHILFYNYKGLSSEELNDVLTNSGATFLSVKVDDNHYVRVGMKGEVDVRLAYDYLKKDPKYKVGVIFDMEDVRKHSKK